MTARSISPDLFAALKRLRLGDLLPTLPERFSLAEKEDTPYEDLLLMLLVDEISRRDSSDPSSRRSRPGSRHGAGALGQVSEGDVRPAGHERARLAPLRRGSP
jgi:hypothetical protein